MKNPFASMKNLPGLKSGNVRIAIGLFVAICLAGIIYVLQADNLSGNGNKSESDQNNNTPGGTNASTVNDIVSTAPALPSKSGASAPNSAIGGSATSNNASGPVIIRNDQAHNQTQQQDPNVQQMEQIRQQAKTKQLQSYYAAYGAKTVANSGVSTKSSSSGISSQGNNNNVGNIESNNLVNDTNSPYLGSELIKPKSDYLVQAGSIIPAVMISGLNSDISGQVLAQVRENVYDSISGRYLLIPQGSKLVGQFSNQVAYGQNRIAVAWQRVIYPNGYSLSLKGIPGSSVDGFSGFYDQVDNHYWQLFGASFVMGVVTAGMQYSQNSTNPTTQTGGFYNPTVGQTMAGSLGQQLGQTGMMITQKQLNIAPTITVRQGYKFTVMMTADVELKPYKQGM